MRRASLLLGAALFGCMPDFEPLPLMVASDAGPARDAEAEPDANFFSDAWVRPDPPAFVGWREYAAGVPVGRDRHSLVYSPLDRRVYLIGGVGRGEHYDTWAWNGATWMELTDAGSYRTSVDHAVAEDRTGRLIMFGGQELNQSQPINSMYRFEDGRWSQVSPRTVPSPRAFSGIAYDHQRELTILYGGTVRGGVTDETWTWDGEDWARVEIAAGASAQPGALHAARLVYDFERGRVLMFGGKTAGNQYKNELWSFEGDRWRQVATFGAPPTARSDSAVAYDVARRALVVFGGSDGGPPLGDTHELIDSEWREVDRGDRPHPVWNTRAAYDRAGSRVVLFGGSFTDAEGWKHTDKTFVLDPAN